MSATSFVFGVDLDGVVGDYENAFRAHVAKTKNVAAASLPPMTSWSFSNSGWGISSDEEFYGLHADAVRNGLFLTMDALPGASEQLWRLSDAGIHIRIITHRLVVKGTHSLAAGDTARWLDLKSIPFRDLCFIGDKPQAGADLYVDDAPHNIANLRASAGEQAAVVFDQPYNRHLDGPRATNWAELADYVLERAGIDG